MSGIFCCGAPGGGGGPPGPIGKGRTSPAGGMPGINMPGAGGLP